MNMHAATADWDPIWATDNPPSKRWPLYTRGNVGEVFPEVVMPFTWGLFGQQAEDGWRAAFERMGLLMPGDMDADEKMVILGVFGGYCYLNATYIRILGVRAPGGSVDVIDQQFFGESDAPAYVERPGDKNVKSSLKLGRLVLKLLGTKTLPHLDEDKVKVEKYVATYPGDDATDEQLMDHIEQLRPLFEHLFSTHIETTFSASLVLGAVSDLCVKAGKQDKLVAILGGIGDVESAGPSSAMWRLGRDAAAIPEVNAEFDKGVSGLLDRLGGIDAATGWVAAFEGFLTEYGSRGPNEWDVASASWGVRPELALAAIDRMRGADPAHDPDRQASRLAGERAAAIAEVRSSLNVIDRFQFDKALAATVVFSQGRERSKTTVIRAIHSTRLAQRARAARAAAKGGPEDPKTSCLLTPEEFKAFLDDPSAFADTFTERGELYDKLAGLIPPFIIDGTVPPIDEWESRDSGGETVTSGELIQGIAGCPGTARGRARVVLDAADPGALGPGDVLVAPITDPSWTPLFLAANAVVVDVGATMSHAVIVSRELGIPCVVSAVGATSRIPDGAIIEVDGDTGQVTVLELP